MNIKYGIREESYKLSSGVDYASNDKECFQNSSIRLVTGKNSWRAFQVIVKGDEDFILSTDVNPAFSPLGPLKNIRVKCEVEGAEEISIKVSPIGLIEDDDRIYRADLILNEDTVVVKKDAYQCMWVELSVPDYAASGLYHGRVTFYESTMFEDEKEIGTMNFELDVKNVVSPQPRNYKFHLDLWQHLSNIARKHEVILWSDEHFTVIERYVESLAKLGQKAVTIIASEIPWSGQGCFNVTNYPSNLFEYSIVRVVKEKNGDFNYDFSIMERYIKLCFEYGIDREIEIFGLTGIWQYIDKGYGKVAEDYPDAIRIRYLDRNDNCYKYIKSGIEIKKYIKALEAYFIESGWIEQVRIVADEPSDIDLYRERLSVIEDIAPSFKFKTAINHSEFIDEFKDRVTDFVPVLGGLCDTWDLIEKMKERINGRLLWYVCCWPPFPNTFIRSHLLESRFIGLFTAYLKVDGFLRWNYTVWPENPRERISYRYPSWSAGDTNFVYPGANGAPILTLRYKNLNRGIEEYELINRLREKHPEGDKALEKVWNQILRSRVVKDFNSSNGKRIDELFSLDHEDYEKVRELLLSELEKLSQY